MVKTVLVFLACLPSVLKCDSVSLPVAVYQLQAGFVGNPVAPPPLYNVTSQYPPSPVHTTSPQDVTPFIINGMSSKATAGFDLAADYKGVTAYSTLASEDLSLVNTLPPDPESGTSLLSATATVRVFYYVELQEIQAPPTVIDLVPVIVTATVSADCSGSIRNGLGNSLGGSNATVTVGGSQTYTWSADCNGITAPLHVSKTSSATDLFGVLSEVVVSNHTSRRSEGRLYIIGERGKD